MNGGHTDWSADCPVEAVQIRLNGIFGDRFDVYYRSNLSDGTECDWSKNGGTNGAMAALSPACASPCGAKELTALLTRWTIH